jgi:hypothetical protein
MNAELIHYLETSAGALTDRVLAEMYQDPFWYARYAERAERHGRQDGEFHIKYLVTALASNDRKVMVEYARWLQQLLTTRGMCTRHLDDNFRLLAAAITHADREAAVAMLEAARSGLRYPEGAARRLQELAVALRERVTPALCAAHAEWSADQCAREVDHLLSYVADAVALGNPAQFRAHVAWTRGYLDSHGIPGARLTDALAAIRAELAGELSAQTLAALFE